MAIGPGFHTRGKLVQKQAFFIRENGHFIPTGIGKSPWNPKAQTGVCLAGLAAFMLESAESPSPMFTARLTLDILGAVPLEPMTCALRPIRNGRNFQVLDLEISGLDRTWVRASALRVREATSPVSTPQNIWERPDEPSMRQDLKWIERIPCRETREQHGRGRSWMRFTTDVVDGTPLSPFCGMAMASDFGSGTSSYVSRKEWTFANLDVSIHLTRPPVGEWMLVDASTESAGNGVGVVHTRLGDGNGMVGMAHQTIFLQPR